jgi:hypothetical protein
MKRYEAVVSHLKSLETLTKCELETLEALAEKNYRSGVLSVEEFAQLVEWCELSQEEYYHYATATLRAETNLRRSHVAYCRVRALTTKKAQALTSREAITLLKTPREAEVSLSPPLLVLDNSLPIHAPPRETESNTETLSS